jgi:DNA invertase Pin-like site-specific DNA recombinase
VSTEKQASEGASLEAQQRIYREHAAAKGWTTVAEFRGHESATQAAADRRVLQQVLACVRDTEPDAVYVHEQSRLTRGDDLEVAMLLREFRERRLKIIVNGVVRDLSSIDERFMVGIQGLVDRAESERIKERMVRGKRERAKQGKKTGGPAPFGYTNPPPGQPGRGTLVVVPDEAAVVRKIFTLAASGTNDRKIVAALNESGSRAPRGGKWGKSTVRRIIECVAYMGTSANNVWIANPGSRTFRRNMANDRAIVVKNAHPAIVDEDLWAAANGRPKQPRTAKPRMLTGLLWWQGVPLSGDSHNGGSYYRAPRGSRGAPWLPTEVVDHAVWDAFAKLATGEAFVAGLMREAEKAQDRALIEQEVEHLAGQVAKLERRLDRLVTMRADGEIDKDTYAKRRGEAEAERASLASQLAAQRARLAVFDGAGVARVVRAVRTLLGGRTRLCEAQKRQILRSVVRRVNVEAERVAADFARDERGRVLPGRTDRWRVRSVELTLAVSPNEEVCESAAGNDGYRDGQLVTTPLGCAQLAETESTNGSGHKVTTLLGSDQVAVTEDGGDTNLRPGQLVRAP